MTRLPEAADLFEAALMAAAVAFVAGALACLVAPRRGRAPTPGAFDLFADVSGLAQKQTARLVMNAPVAGGDDAAAFGGVLAVPGRDDAARPLDDRRSATMSCGLRLVSITRSTKPAASAQ